jgi:phenylalanyl-tRNA synthetase beta chain
MKISLDWISDHADIKINSKEIVKKLKLHTTDVEGIEYIGSELSNVYVGLIEKIEPHPNADKLIKCSVKLGDKKITIVTGDLTVNEGDKVPVAIDGAVLYGNFKIKTTKLRGEKSEGMFCSLEEIGLEENSDAVYKITEDVTDGTDFLNYFKIKDEVIGIEILPNRPDLLSYNGTAREFFAVGIAENIKSPEIKSLSEGNGFPVIINYDMCKRYSALKIKNVEIKKSPLWLVKRLASSGIRSINNVVDITNYVMLEYGHPIHAFDMKLIGEEIVVRKAEKDEKVLLLDGKEYKMNGEETLITDGKNILALGGVMGGELSGINDETKDVLIEIAYFDPVNIRKSSKYHKLSTDSSYRFERGVDPNDVPFVMGRVAKLMEEIAGGISEEIYTDIYTNKIEPLKINLRKDYLFSKLGIEIKDEDIELILNKFEFKHTKNDNVYEVISDTKRPDIEKEINLVEEIGRIYGYYNINSCFPTTEIKSGSFGDFFDFKYKISELVRANGFHEARTFSFMNINNMWLEKSDIKLLNPLSQEYEYMRPLTIYGVLESISYNYRNQNRDVKLFEISKTFHSDSNLDTGIKEVTTVALAATGRENIYDYSDKRNVTFFSLKGVFENISEHFNIKFDYQRAEIEGLQKSQSAFVFVDGEKLGFIGLLDSEIAKKYYDIKSPVYIAELNLDIINSKKQRLKKDNTNFDFPAVKREYSLLVPFDVEYNKLEKIIFDSSKLVEKINIFDIYKGKGIKDNKTSITITIVYRSANRTLKDDEVNKVEEKILNEFKNLEVYLRERDEV